AARRVPARGRLAGQAEAGAPPLPARRPQEAAQHLEGGRLAGPVRAEQPEDLPARDGEADVVARREVADALGEPARLDDGLIAARGAHRARRSPLRTSAGAAAAHVGAGSLEAWRRRPHLGARAGPTPGPSDRPVLRLGRPRDDDAKRLALDDAVDDAAPAEHLGEHRAPALPDAGQPEDAAVHLPGEIRRRPGKEQFARVEQEDPVT